MIVGLSDNPYKLEMLFNLLTLFRKSTFWLWTRAS